MEYRRLGSSGLRVSEVGLGSNNFGWFLDEEQSVPVIHRALDIGVNFIDTADVYDRGHSEEFLSRALAGRRHEAILATKLGGPFGRGPNEVGLSYGRVIACCEASLRRLGTDYIDLYYLHRPDPNTPLEETLRAMDDLVRQGKIRYLGISNYPAWQACEMLWISDRQGYRPPVVTQNRYNMLDRGIETDLLPFCTAHNMGIVPYSPLANGFLTGKYRPGEPPPPGTRGSRDRGGVMSVQELATERNFEILAGLDDFARSRDHTIGEVAIAWLLGHPEIPSVIAGATKPEQVEANVAAASWKLTAEEMQQVGEILAPRKAE